MEILTLDTERETIYKGLLALAAQVSSMPIAVVSFFDTNTYISVNDELENADLINDAAVKEYFLKNTETLVVPNLSLGHNVHLNNILNYSSSIKFYAAIPLWANENLLLGHLSIIGYTPRKLSEAEIRSLELIAKQVEHQFIAQARIAQLEKDERNSANALELMKAVFHNAGDGVILLDSEGYIFKLNPKAEEIFDWKADEVIGRSFGKIGIEKRSYNEYLGILNHCKANRHRHTTNQTIEICACRADKVAFDIALTVSSAILHDKFFYICFASDITERKTITKQLDKQKAFYEVILNKIPTDIAVFDAEHRYLFVNPGAISNEEYRKFIIGKDDYDYAAYRNRNIAVAHSRRAQFMQVKTTGKEIRWEDSLVGPKGNVITHLRRMFPVYNEDGELTMVIGFGLDITDRKIMEEKQDTLVKQLSTQNTQLVDFCNIVSHNLRAPLVNISMLVDFIEECDDADDQKLLVSKLQPVIANLHTTFNELVESIQIKYDLEIESDEIDLNTCVERTLKSLQTEINQLHATVESDFSQAAVISYPSKYLYSIFHNLISNSLKYHSPKRQPIIKLSTKIEGGKIVLTVKDNGLGIDLVKHKENFFKIGKVFHRHPNSKGFGLFMTKTQVESMGGKIWVESQPDEGSSFFIEFTNQPLCSLQ